MRESTEEAILSRMRSHDLGWAFSSKDFTDLGSRESIDTALHRLSAKGVIRRVMRGIYDLSAVSRITGEPVSPDVWSVARTIARKNGWRIVPSGETALNVLGLSTQVPGTYLFFTDGQSREYRLGNRRLCFRRRTPRDLQSADGIGALVVQALKALGRERVDGAVVEALRRKLSPGECRELLQSARYGTDWVYSTVKRICAEGEDG